MTVNDFINKWNGQNNVYLVEDYNLDECTEALDRGEELTNNYTFCMFNPEYSQYQVQKYLKPEIANAEVDSFYIYGKGIVLFIRYEV